MYKEVFQIRLQARRKELGLTQYDVSAETGIIQTNVSKYETGKLEPSLETLGKLAEFYQVSTDWLLGNQYNKEEGNIIKTALTEYKEEIAKTIGGAIEQGLKGEELLKSIYSYMEKDLKEITKKYTP